MSIDQVASAESAREGSITFVNEEKYLPLVQHSTASAVIATESVAEQLSQSVLIHPNPYLAYAKVAQLLNPRVASFSGISSGAHIASSAQLGKGVAIAAGAVVGEHAVIGDNTVLHAAVVVEDNVRIGKDCWLAANVTVCRDSQLGDRVAIQAGAVIGSDGFGYANEQGRWQRIPQIGGVVIGNDVEIGANTCIDRGALNDTLIEDGVILDNLIQVAHNVHIAEGSAVAAISGIAGSAKIGKRCTLAGGTKVVGHINIADGTHVAADTLVSNDIKQAGAYAGSLPMDDVKSWRKNAVRFKQLDDMAKRLKRLEKQLAEK